VREQGPEARRQNQSAPADWPGRSFVAGQPPAGRESSAQRGVLSAPLIGGEAPSTSLNDEHPILSGICHEDSVTHR